MQLPFLKGEIRLSNLVNSAAPPQPPQNHPIQGEVNTLPAYLNHAALCPPPCIPTPPVLPVSG